MQKGTFVVVYHKGMLRRTSVLATDAQETTVVYTDEYGRFRRITRSTKRLIAGHNAILNLAEAITNNQNLPPLQVRKE